MMPWSDRPVSPAGRESMNTFKEEGLPIFIVKQNLVFALKVGDFLHVISKGRIVHSSAPKELRENEEIKSQYLGS